MRFAFVRRERKEGNKESEWQRETIKRANTSEIKRQRKARTKENLMWVEYAVSDNKADCCIHRQQFGQHGKRKKVKGLGYWIFSLIREILCPLRSTKQKHLITKPIMRWRMYHIWHNRPPEQNGTFSGGEVEERRRGTSVGERIREARKTTESWLCSCTGRWETKGPFAP